MLILLILKNDTTNKPSSKLGNGMLSILGEMTQLITFIVLRR
jgi:hypothetical protein